MEFYQFDMLLCKEFDYKSCQMCRYIIIINHEPLIFTYRKFSGNHLLMDQLAMTASSSSNFMALTSFVLLKKTAFIYFLTARCSNTEVCLESPSKKPYFICCVGKSKKRYVHFVTSYDFKNYAVSTNH